MQLYPEVVSALIGAGVTVLAAGGAAAIRALQQHRERRRETETRYLYPLKLACDDLLAYWIRLEERIDAGEGDVIRADFERIRDTCTEPGFYRRCNDDFCNGVGTLHATACYFAYSRKLRDELPRLDLGYRKTQRLWKGAEAVRNAIGDGSLGGLWTEIQDSIGSLVVTADGAVLSYAGFCRLLVADPQAFFRLHNFYVDIKKKRLYQLKNGCERLSELSALLDRLLHVPHSAPGFRASVEAPAATSATAPSGNHDRPRYRRVAGLLSHPRRALGRPHAAGEASPHIAPHT